MSLRVSAEFLLEVLVCTTGTLLSRRLDIFFSDWEIPQRHGSDQMLRRLEQRGLLAREERAGEVVYRLTDAGRLRALGGRDPIADWARQWDGSWRLMLFDLPVSQQLARQRLLRWLRNRGFGYLQHSVWITPDPVQEVVGALKLFHDVESFALMEATCIAGHSNADLVIGGWDFTEINRRYEAYTRWLKAHPASRRNSSDLPLGAWLKQERTNWRRAFSLDPLLPRLLWPTGYQGEAAFAARRQALQSLAPK